MEETTLRFHDTHYVEIDESLCTGCVICMKACPTRAIRVKEGRARIEGFCIDCGECIRACPRAAIKAVTTAVDPSNLKKPAILSVSPVIHVQFGEDITPNDILLSLRREFKFVYDQGYANEIFNVATELYIREQREKGGASWPLISPCCPVVNRLIAFRFPELLDNITPLITPHEMAGKDIRERLRSENLPHSGDIEIYHVTPCSAEMISIREPMALKTSFLNGAIGISEVFKTVSDNLKKLDQDVLLHRSGGIGIGWCMSGGEIAGMDSGAYLAVSGIQETLRYLEKIEMGQLHNIEYIEFRACTEGCIGGPMNVIDKYLAKNRLERLSRMFGIEKRTKLAQIKKAYKAGWFFGDTKRVQSKTGSGRLSISEAINRQGRIEEILKQLPSRECGACGSPDCRTFAEDVAEGRNSLENCPFYDERR